MASCCFTYRDWGNCAELASSRTTILGIWGWSVIVRCRTSSFCSFFLFYQLTEVTKMKSAKAEAWFSSRWRPVRPKKLIARFFCSRLLPALLIAFHMLTWVLQTDSVAAISWCWICTAFSCRNIKQSLLPDRFRSCYQQPGILSSYPVFRVYLDLAEIWKPRDAAMQFNQGLGVLIVLVSGSICRLTTYLSINKP